MEVIEIIEIIKNRSFIFINSVKFQVLSYNSYDIDDNSDWKHIFVLTKDDITYKLEFIFHEDYDYFFDGVYLNNVQIDVSSINFN
ncbi:MAG: hypothetical protein ACMXYC_01760 [Candidatus Woesearchaeota archaeon]